MSPSLLSHARSTLALTRAGPVTAPDLRTSRRPLPGLLVACLGVLALALSTLAMPSRAVLIDTGDGTGNTTPPSADPGFSNVGEVNGLTGVYVRNGWVLTAAHVGAAPFTVGGVTYPVIEGSRHRFSNPDTSQADLLAFKLVDSPPLPDLLLANAPPAANTLLTVVGRGRSRGPPTSWMGLDGWSWGSTREIRWGTNRISQVGLVSLDTQTFWTRFDDLPGQGGSQHEADIVSGDSGGAAFVGSGSSAELVGILIARATFEGQPSSTSFYGNSGIAADLFAYRSELLAVIDRPDCDDGLDDDGDGLADYPLDPGCSSPTDTSEHDISLACDNDLDDDGDGLVDLADPSCTDAFDPSEKGPLYECDNGIDDDGDLMFDYPWDSGCLHPSNLVEAPEPGLLTSLLVGAAGLAASGRRRERPARRTGHSR